MKLFLLSIPQKPQFPSWHYKCPGILAVSAASTSNTGHLCGTVTRYLHIRKGKNASIKADYNSLITIAVPHQGASILSSLVWWAKCLQSSGRYGKFFFLFNWHFTARVKLIRTALFKKTDNSFCCMLEIQHFSWANVSEMLSVPTAVTTPLVPGLVGQLRSLCFHDRL